MLRVPRLFPFCIIDEEDLPKPGYPLGFTWHELVGLYWHWRVWRISVGAGTGQLESEMPSGMTINWTDIQATLPRAAQFRERLGCGGAFELRGITKSESNSLCAKARAEGSDLDYGDITFDSTPIAGSVYEARLNLILHLFNPQSAPFVAAYRHPASDLYYPSLQITLNMWAMLDGYDSENECEWFYNDYGTLDLKTTFEEDDTTTEGYFLGKPLHLLGGADAGVSYFDCNPVLAWE